MQDTSPLKTYAKSGHTPITIWNSHCEIWHQNVTDVTRTPHYLSCSQMQQLETHIDKDSVDVIRKVSTENHTTIIS